MCPLWSCDKVVSYLRRSRSAACERLDLPAGGGISCLLLLPRTSQLASLVVGYLAHPYFRRLPGTGRWSRCAAVLFGGFLAVRLARRLTFNGLTARDSWLAIFCLSGVCLNGRCPGAWERSGPFCRAKACSKATLGWFVGLFRSYGVVFRRTGLLCRPARAPLLASPRLAAAWGQQAHCTGSLGFALCAAV